MPVSVTILIIVILQFYKMIEKTKSNETKQIAENTVFLYFRMFLTMIISLYTSRVILEVLGVNDYGIYQSVCGIVTFLSFLNGALATGSSRFLTFELGKEENQQLDVVFSTILIIHVVLAIFVFFVGETIGLWFVKHKLIIPEERMAAAVFAFHFSMLTALFTITQVPYDSLIIAHEHMNIYAYVSIVEVSLKLVIVFLLRIGNFDKLKLYAVFLFIVTVLVMGIYRFYCRCKFQEVKNKFSFNKKIFKEIAAFSGWSLFAAASIAVSGQGITVVTNMFFPPAVVTARTLALQANNAINQFINNFRLAVNPQIVKKYAAKDFDGSQRLLLDSTKFSYFLMWLIILPLLLLTEPVLKLWLGKIPGYTLIFLQIIIVQSLFQVFDSSFYTAMYAKGQLKENALISPAFGFIQLPIVYLLFKSGFSPVVLSYVSLACYMILGLIIKPILICKIANYKRKDIINIFIACGKVSCISAVVPFLSVFFFDKNTVFGFIMILFISILSVLLTIFFFGLDKCTRKKIKIIIMKRFNSQNIE
jgi:O-antigen/teichoic acid export membrane protein